MDNSRIVELENIIKFQEEELRKKDKEYKTMIYDMLNFTDTRLINFGDYDPIKHMILNHTWMGLKDEAKNNLLL